MKRRWKIFWISCAVSGLVGIIFLVIAFAMGVTFQKVESNLPNGISIGGFESIEPSDQAIEVTGDDMYDGIQELDIDLSAGELKIVVSENKQISIQTEGISQKLDLQYYRDGDGLVITTEKNLGGIINQSLGTVTIYLPKEYQLNEADINVHAGSLYIEDICAKELSVDVGAGEANIHQFEAKEADLDCGAGEIIAFGQVDEIIDIDCGMGMVSFRTVDDEQHYNYELTCGVGEIICGSHSYSGIGGSQKVDNKAEKEMNIDCGIGKVNVNFEK